MEAAPREARKVITALFADVVGSTALGERLDPEDLQEVVGEGVARAVRAAEEFGGQVDRIAGDGALILFGAPVAHEDDPERAVLAGLRILEVTQAYAGELSRERGLQGFAVRVGVETGVAVLAALGGARPIEFSAIGDVLNTAARLEAAAAPGTLLVGAHTFERVEAGFEWGEPSELSLKGKADAVLGHRPLRPRAPGTGRRAPGFESPLVGRERELAVLRDALARLLDGQGGVLALSGEPGLGKTRLLAELRERTERSGATGDRAQWLEGRCVSYGEQLPYFPFRVLIRDWLGASPDASDAAVGELLERRLQELLPDRHDDLRPLLGSVLALAPRAQDTARISGLGPEDLQSAVFDAVLELVRRLARDAPVVLALDDLHWADGTSLALAEELVALVADSPLLLVLAARPEGVARLAEQALRRQPAATTRLTLEALIDQSDRALLSTLARGANFPDELERRVLERAEGNPLYLEELVRALIDAGALVRSDDGWRFERDVEVHVPETVEKLVLARVDVLSPVARELLAAAAVVGRRFTEGLLGRVAGDASALPELLAAELVLEAPRGSETGYRFKHHLIQEATYGSLLKRRRQELHRRAAEAIEAAFAGPREERLGVLAHHWEAAGEYEHALDCHARAGVAAEAIGAADEALDQYAAACAAAAELGLDARDPRVADVLSKRGRVLFYTGKRDEGAAQLEAALDGARASGNRKAELEVLSHLAWQRHGGYANAIALGEEALAIARSLDDPRPQVFALSRLAILDANRLALARALAEGREALEIAERAGGDELVGLARDGLKLAQLKLGDLDAVARHTAELIEIHERTGDLFYLEWALLESSYPLLGAGRLEQARNRAGDALALNRRLGDRANEPLFHDVLCWIARAEGDYPLALEHGRRAVSKARERGTGEWHAWTAATLGWVLLDLRSATEAAGLLEVGIEAAREVQATGERLRCTALLAWARWLLGEHERALSLAEDAELMLADVTTPPGEAWLFGAHAQLALARTRLAAGEPERCAPMARLLLDAAGRNGWRDTAAAAAVVVAGCEDALGRPDAAAEVLEVAFPAAGAPAAAWEARLELARLGGPGADRYAAEARDLLERVLARLGHDPAGAALRAAYLPASAAARATKP